jgi:hypothetical protein
MGDDKIAERVIIVEQIAASAHKRLDDHGAEIGSLREARHLHSNALQRHQGTIDQHSEILDGIKRAVDNLTHAITSFRAMVIMGLFMGSGFISFFVFVGGKVINWW